MKTLSGLPRPPVVWAAVALLGVGALLMIPAGSLAVLIAGFLLVLTWMVASGMRGARAVVWFLAVALFVAEIARLLSFPSLQALQERYASVFASGQGWVYVCFWTGELCQIAAAVLLALPSARPFFQPRLTTSRSIGASGTGSGGASD